MYIKLLAALFFAITIGGGTLYIKNKQVKLTPPAQTELEVVEENKTKAVVTSTGSSPDFISSTVPLAEVSVVVSSSIKLPALVNAGKTIVTPVTSVLAPVVVSKSVEPKPAEPKPVVLSNVFINGRELSEQKMNEIASTYGKTPVPGKYWYDSRSGLFGVMGGPSVGTVSPGLSYGTVSVNASNGDTCVYVNGRLLPQSEFIFLSRLVGSEIQCGRYWLEANGNAGVEGVDTPVVNLYLAASASGGSRSSGDNFFSTGYSAGNSNADNSQGYAYVPGYGAVGYGF